MRNQALRLTASNYLYLSDSSVSCFQLGKKKKKKCGLTVLVPTALQFKASSSPRLYTFSLLDTNPKVLVTADVMERLKYNPLVFSAPLKALPCFDKETISKRDTLKSSDPSACFCQQ